MNSTPKIVLVGAGRIGMHLGRRLKSKGLRVQQILNRTSERAEELAQMLDCDWSVNWEDVLPDADWVILAVRDDAIESVAEALKPYCPDALVTHTSGATPGLVIKKSFRRFGVFYPLQSFSMDRMPVWSKVSFCVDAGSAEDVVFLKKIAKRIGNLVYQVDDKQRAVLHIAAVFANNFSNHCYTISERILDEANLPFELMHPLIEETVSKALLESPARMQTGPAIRGDQETIDSHMKLLKTHPDLQTLYLLFSKNINPDLK
ncbi:MAG: DUF2520 domain-containing protein [Saprospiraceae bacterium]